MEATLSFRLNEPQAESFIRLRETMRWADEATIIIRKDGVDHWFQADWLLGSAAQTGHKRQC